MDSSVSVEPDALVKGTVASVKEVTTEDVIEIQSQEPLSAQGSEEHFQWLKDAAQVVAITGMITLHPICDSGC